jgi:hypothetical protein
MTIVLETYNDTNAEVKITRNQIKFFFIVSTQSQMHYTHNINRDFLIYMLKSF